MNEMKKAPMKAKQAMKKAMKEAPMKAKKAMKKAMKKAPMKAKKAMKKKAVGMGFKVKRCTKYFLTCQCFRCRWLRVEAELEPINDQSHQ